MRIAVVAAVACLSVVGLSAAADAQAAMKRLTNIPAQPLSTALQALAKERSFQIVYLTEVVSDLKTRGAAGELSIEEALSQLLSGTRLSFRYLDEKTITIVAADSYGSASYLGGGSATAPMMPLGSASGESAVQTERSDLANSTMWGRFRLAQVQESDTSGQSTAASAPRASDKSLAVIDEIIVTAQKRAERLQDVPISISVLSGAELDKSTVRGVADELNRLPGVIASVNTTSARLGGIANQVIIRGVSPLSGGASATAYYLDSIPFGFVRQTFAPDAGAYDLERVEVLRGPQGTLYGLSALNGVVRVLTKDANLDQFELKARTSGAGTEDGSESYRGDMAINVPLMEGKFAARAVAGYQHLGGWIDKSFRKDANDADIGNYRLKINSQPTDRLSVGAFAWVSRTDVDGSASSADGMQSLSPIEEPSSIDYEAYGLDIGYDFSQVTVSSTTSYIDFKSHGKFDFAPFTGVVSYSHTNFDSIVFAQEILLSSALEGPWRWSLGGIYRDTRETQWTSRTNPVTGALVPPIVAPTDQRTFSESFATFGELTRAFFDGRLELTGGLRYFEDRIRDVEVSANGPGGLPTTGSLVRTSAKFDHISPRAVLAWHPGAKSSLYASYGEGFRSGLQQLPNVSRAAPQFPPAEPDKLRNYEVGAKGSAWDGRFDFEAAVFYMEWLDVQQSLSVLVTPPSQFAAALVNEGSASGVGFEVGANLAPVQGLTLGANFSWNDLSWDEDVVSRNFAGQSVTFQEGSRLPFSPEYTLAGRIDYRFPLGENGYAARVSTSANYVPSLLIVRSGTTCPTGCRAEALWMTQASVALESPGGWTATLYAENLANEEGLRQDQFSPRWNTYIRPRTIGLQVEYQF